MIVAEDTLMKDIVELYPESYEILARFGVNCLACDGIINKTIKECAMFHRIEPEILIKELKQLEIPRVDKS